MKRLVLAAALLALACLAFANPMEPSKSLDAASFGVKADGRTPSADALQKAIDSFPGGAGGSLRLPAGRIVLDKTVAVKENVYLTGAGPSWENTATVFVVKHKEGPAFSLGAYCGVKGVCVEYPDNLSDAKMRKPDEYGPAFELRGSNVTLEYIHFDGAWIGVASAGTGANNGQSLFSNINGFCHHRGFRLSGSADINRFENVHFFPSRSNQYTEPDAYYAHNLIAFDFGRQDGAMFTDCFIILGKAFFRQSVDSPGEGSNIGIPNHPYNASLGYGFFGCWIEAVDCGFDIEGVCGFNIVNCNVLVNKGGTGIRIAAETIAYNGVVTGTQIRGFGGDNDFCGIDYDLLLKYWSHNAMNKLTISDCQIQGASPAIRLRKNSRRAWIKGCTLSGTDKSPALIIDEGAEYVTVKDNIFQYGNSDAAYPLKAAEGNKEQTVKNNVFEDLSKEKPKVEDGQ
ncbi:MAG: hypothetical protein IJT95_03855 [Abditibacteriota bacterium]|nr:hypothetical protein [Abditibacteriota bacterium]